MTSQSEKNYVRLQKAQQQRMVSDVSEQTTGSRDSMLDTTADMMEQRAVEALNEQHEANAIPGGEVFKETLEKPQLSNIQASHDRQLLISDAICFDLAIDMAETIDAKNSLEKMLAHQMAACHNAGMRLMQKVNRDVDTVGSHKDDDLRLQRLVNSAGKLMATFQQGVKTIHQIRTGGQQRMTVEHVNVNAGGQAVVGSVTKGGGGNP